MKKILLLLPMALLIFATGNAQEAAESGDNTQGQILYEQVITLNFDVSKMPPEAQQWIEAMPKEIKDNKIHSG